MKTKTQSTIKPGKFSIENINQNKCVILFYDNIEEIQDEESNTIYNYDVYDMEMIYRKELREQIEANYEKYLETVKTNSYNQAAKEIREKRNKLLQESDNEMCLDRIGLEVPEGSSFSNWINFLKGLGSLLKGDMARYRQELRDITTQPGFPYNVEFPQKPTNSN